MSFADKIKGLFDVPDEEFFPDAEQEEDDLVTYTPSERERPVKRRPMAPAASKQRRQAPIADEDESDKVVNIHTTAQLKVVITKPERFEDARGIADSLNQKRTVVLNLESASRDVAHRLVDFLSGVAYANDGEIKKVANNTFIITPYNVDLTGDLLDELENTGMFFGFTDKR